MATEVTFKSIFAGRLPGVPGGAKVPGPGLKVKFGIFTIGTAEYPVGGYVAADLEPLVGFTRIEAIVPCGALTVAASNTLGFHPSWDQVARKLQVFGNIDADTGNTTAGTEASYVEMGSNDASIDGGTFAALVIGY